MIQKIGNDMFNMQACDLLGLRPLALTLFLGATVPARKKVTTMLGNVVLARRAAIMDPTLLPWLRSNTAAT